MCGRYSLTKKEMRVVSKFPPGELQLFLQERYNISPTEAVPVITLEGGRLATREVAWGLRPAWSKSPVINAKAESLLQKPTFREAFQERRCLIPADGFFEWRKPDKMPFQFTRPDHGAFCFAGFWDEAPAGDAQERCVIITTAASEVVLPIHHRMPLALEPGQYDAWLADAAAAAQIAREPCRVEFTKAVAEPLRRTMPAGTPDLFEQAG